MILIDKTDPVTLSDSGYSKTLSIHYAVSLKNERASLATCILEKIKETGSDILENVMFWKKFKFSGSQKICEDCCKDPDHQDAPYFHGQFMKQTGKWVFPRRGYFGKGKF